MSESRPPDRWIHNLRNLLLELPNHCEENRLRIAPQLAVERLEERQVFAAFDTLTATSGNYTEQDGNTLLVASAVISGLDTSKISDGTLSVSISGAQSGDALTLLNQGVGDGQVEISGANVIYHTGGTGVTIGTFSTGSGTLTIDLSKDATATALQAVLTRVAFSNPTDTPNGETTTTTLARTFNITLDDSVSAAANGSVLKNVVAVNDEPTVGVAFGTIAVNQGEEIAISGINLGDLDAFAFDVRLTVDASGGTLSLVGLPGSITAVTNTATQMVLEGSLADLQAFLDGGGLHFTADNDPADVTVDFTLNDLGNTGTGGPLTDSESLTLAVNDTPTLDVSVDVALDDQTEDDAAPAGPVGTLVSSLVDLDNGSGLDNVTDDGPDLGIALIGVDSTNGVWWYSTDGGTLWQLVPSVAANSALVLDLDARLYFQPNTNFNGTIASAITFKAWDQSDGLASGDAGVDTTTGVSYSVATDVASLFVAPVNDRPLLDAGAAPALPAIIEDVSDGANTGATVAAIVVNGSITEVPGDNAAVEAIAVYEVDNTNGVWQYDVGGGWTDFTGVTGSVVDLSTAAVVLPPTTLVRFVPDANYNGSASIRFRAWDQTDGRPAGSTVDLTAAGILVPTGAFSDNTNTATIQITPQLDAPIVTGATTLEDTKTSSGLVILPATGEEADVAAFRITNIQNGTLYRQDGTLITDGKFISAADAAAGLLFLPDPDSDLDGSFDVQASSDLLGTELGDVATATIDVQAVADTPTVAVTTPAAGVVLVPIPLDISAALVDTDGSETLSIEITIPTGVTAALTAGSYDILNDVWVLTPAQLVGLQIVVSTPLSGDFNLAIEVISTEGAGDAAVPSASAFATLQVVLNNDPPVVSVSAPLTTIDEGDTLTISGSYTDDVGTPMYTSTWEVILGGSVIDAYTVTDTFANGNPGPAPVPSFDFIPTDNGLYTIRLTVFDGIDAGVSTIDILVNNVAPTADLALVAPPALEGMPFDVTFTNILEPSTDDLANLRFSYALSPGALAADFASAGAASTQSFTFSDNGSYVIYGRVFDDDGGVSDVIQITVDVQNVAPIVQTIQIRDVADTTDVTAINENQSIRLRADIVDPGLDTITVLVDWGDGSTSTINLGTGERSIDVTHHYLDDPSGIGTVPYAISITAVDDDSGAATPGGASITVNNVAPTLGGIANQTAVESTSITISGLTFSDPGTLDTFTLEVDWDEGDGFVSLGAVSSPYSLTNIFEQDGTYDVTVRLTDDDGGVDTFTFTVTVNNSPPQAFIDAISTPRQEGTGITTQIRGTDIGLEDLLTYEWEVFFIGTSGDVSVDAGFFLAQASNTSQSFVFIPGDNGSYRIVLRVTDDHDTVSTEQTITVVNVAPTVNSPPPTPTINEGDAYELVVSWQDPAFIIPGVGNSETFTIDIDWGDGIIETGLAPTSTSQSSAFGPTVGEIFRTHVYADNSLAAFSEYMVRVTVRDDDGGANSSFVMRIQVNNVAPQVDGSTEPVLTTSINEGGSISLADLVRFVDPGFNNPFNPNVTGGTRESFNYQINWGDGTPIEAPTSSVVTQGSAGVATTIVLGATHTYADNGVYVATVTLFDDDGGRLDFTFTVIVANVAPQITAAPITSTSADEGALVVLDNLLSFRDPGFDNPANPLQAGGSRESFVYTIDWGDGQIERRPASVDRVGAPGVDTLGTVDAAHVFADNGTYRVRVSVEDDDGGLSSTFEFIVTIRNVPPRFTGLPSSITGSEGEPLEFGPFNFFDPGFTNPLTSHVETFRVQINFNDPFTIFDDVIELSFTPGEPGTDTLGKITGQHIYVQPGQYTMQITVTDDDGGTATASIDVLIVDIPGVGFSLPEVPPTTTLFVPVYTAPTPIPIQQYSPPTGNVASSLNSGQRLQQAKQAFDTSSDSPVRMRVEELSGFRGAVIRPCFTRIVFSQDRDAAIHDLAELPDGIYRLTLSSSGNEPVVREFQLNSETRLKIARGFLALWRNARTSHTPEAQLHEIFPLPGVSRNDPPPRKEAEEARELPQEDQVWQQLGEGWPLALWGQVEGLVEEFANYSAEAGSRHAEEAMAADEATAPVEAAAAEAVPTAGSVSPPADADWLAEALPSAAGWLFTAGLVGNRLGLPREDTIRLTTVRSSAHR